MKTKKLIMLSMGVSSLAALGVAARPVVVLPPAPPPPPPVMVTPPPPIVVPSPPVVVNPPPPVVTVQIGVPDSYIWDGREYVGVVGDQYYYLGPRNVWIAMDPVRLARFHEWAKAHADWRVHAIINRHYRLDAQGHRHPWHARHNHDKHGH